MPTFDASDLAACTRGQWVGGKPKSASGFSIDTRTLKPGQIYVALKGTQHDGHEYVERAFERGAVGAVVQSKSATVNPQLVVADTRAALSDIARAHRARLNAEFVAVTGSIGKTTVKELAADVLSMMAPTARSRGNFNNDLGLPLSLLDMELENRFGVFELGMNHPGELAPLCDLLRPACGIVTTIGPVHIQFFTSVEGIAREKATVLQHLPSNGLAILCRDDKWFDVLKSFAACEVVTVSLKGDADFVARRGSSGVFSVTEKQTGQSTDFIAPLPGEYFVQDALYSIALGRRRGIAWASLVEAVKNFKPITLRWQTQTLNGVMVINDAYNANPISMRAALQAFGEMPCAGRKWLVLAAMRELGASEASEHEALGAHVARGEWAGLVALGGGGQLIADGAERAGFKGRIFRCVKHIDASVFLQESLAAGDAVLLKGSRGERVEEVLSEWTHHKKEEAANHE